MELYIRKIACQEKCQQLEFNRRSDRLQYPEATVKEDVAAIVSMPIFFLQEVIGVLRLYHHEPWDISDRDVDSLMILGETIGLAMMFARLFNTVQTIREAVQG